MTTDNRTNEPTAEQDEESEVPPEREATPDEAFALGEVSGYDEAMEETAAEIERLKRLLDVTQKAFSDASDRYEDLLDRYAECAPHAEHVQLETLAMECVDYECSHRDSDGKPDDFSSCPTSLREVCVDCHEIGRDGRDPKQWEVFAMWPCDSTKQTDRASEPDRR